MARGRRVSLIGQKFGKLTVISSAGTDKFRNSLWKCECDCGNETIEKGTLLTKGKILNCGKCENRLAKNPVPIEIEDKSLVGKKFGRLLVEDTFYKQNSKKPNLYDHFAKCKCDCGTEKEIRISMLKSKRTLSCGCLQKDAVRNSTFNLTNDFVGQRFGKLTVKGYDVELKKWKCECDCGNIIYLKKGNLTTNRL